MVSYNIYYYPIRLQQSNTQSMKLFESVHFTIGFDEEIQATYLIFHDFCNTELFKEAHLRILEAFLKHRSGKHFTDTRNMGAVSPKIQTWVATTIVPEMAFVSPRGKAHIALILGKDVFANFAAENIAEKTTQISHTRFFDQEVMARDWLKGIIL